MVRRFVKSAYCQALSFSGALRRRMERIARENKVAVLNLHRITPSGNDYWPPMHPNVFEELLQFLTQNFEVCSLSEIREAESDTDRPRAVISFDDGYYDFVEYALPLLERYGVRANLNVIPGCVLSGRPIWNVRLYDFLSAADRELINSMQIPGFTHKLAGDGGRSRLEFGLTLSRYLKTKSREDREPIWAAIEAVFPQAKHDTTRMLNLSEVKQISATVDLGAHSFSHESMGFQSAEYFEGDFAECKKFFEQQLSLNLDTYAFPNGSYRPEQIDHLRERGVDNVLLVDERFADCGQNVIPRITMYGDSGLEVRLRALNF